MTHSRCQLWKERIIPALSVAFLVLLLMSSSNCAPQRSGSSAEQEMKGAGVRSVDVTQADQALRFQSLGARRLTVATERGYFPVVTRLKDGTIAAVFRAGAAHVGRGGRLEMAFSKDEGDTWSPPQTVVEGPDDDRNPALGVAHDGTLVLAYAILKGYQPDGTLPHEIFEGVFVIRSTDQGKSWDSPTKIDKFPSGVFSPYGKIVQMSDGALLMHIYAKDDLFKVNAGKDRDYAYAARSHDGGRTWNEISLMAVGFGEVAFLETADKKILAALRTTEQGGGIHTAVSSDYGKIWSPTSRVTSKQEHPADLIQLGDGRIILTHGERNWPMGVQAMVSHDGGTTWNHKEKIALSWLAPNRDTGYPSSMVRRDGKILTVYYQVDDLQNAPRSATCKAVIWDVPTEW